MNERKAGLNKSVSEIFEGVGIPGWQLDDGEGSTATPEAEAPKGPPRKNLPKGPKKKKKQSKMVEHLYAKLLGAEGREISGRQKMMAVMVPVLMVVLVVMMMKVLNVTSPRKAGAQTKPAIPKAESLRRLSQWQTPTEYSPQMRDPMRPAPSGGTQGTDYGNLIVGGILYSQDNPMVVINGQIVRQGDVINEIKVLKINKDNVIFEKNDKRWMQKVQQ